MSRTTPGVQSGYRPFELRAFAVPADARIVGLSIAEAERSFPEARVFVLRLRRRGEIHEVTPELTIEAGDTLAVGGRRAALVAILGPNAAEVEDRDLLDSPFLTAEILVTGPEVVGQTLQSLADAPWARGIYLNSLRRGAQTLPLAADLAIARGDVLKLTGPQATLERGALRTGPVISPTTATDSLSSASPSSSAASPGRSSASTSPASRSSSAPASAPWSPA